MTAPDMTYPTLQLGPPKAAAQSKAQIASRAAPPNSGAADADRASPAEQSISVAAPGTNGAPAPGWARRELAGGGLAASAGPSEACSLRRSPPYALCGHLED